MIVTPIMGVCNCSRFFVRYFMSILVVQSSWWGRKNAGCFTLFVFLVSRGCCMALPHDAKGFFLQFVIVVFPDHTHLEFLNVFSYCYSQKPTLTFGMLPNIMFSISKLTLNRFFLHTV